MLGLLQHLAAAGPLTVGEQAAHLGLGKATATELVDRLERRGLVARMRDDRDRRRVFVWGTPAGPQRAAAPPRVLAHEPLVEAPARPAPDDRERLVVGLRALVRGGEELQR